MNEIIIQSTCYQQWGFGIQCQLTVPTEQASEWVFSVMECLFIFFIVVKCCQIVSKDFIYTEKNFVIIGFLEWFRLNWCKKYFPVTPVIQLIIPSPNRIPENFELVLWK